MFSFHGMYCKVAISKNHMKTVLYSSQNKNPPTIRRVLIFHISESDFMILKMTVVCYTPKTQTDQSML